MSNIQKEITRRARKPHTCCECKQTIRVGETYQYFHGVFDGCPYSEHMCSTCREVGRAWFKYARAHRIEDETPFGMLAECICEGVKEQEWLAANPPERPAQIYAATMYGVAGT